ncbi:unnamed protein product [Protopolystoma xenopodis]|uniref:Uncharacterized protein n=1 Tax=Protopolystoma xenopodis TaxID=117903 RepID=A0A448WY95_9PLAT|nr:unnamed protein product [Protopolystoma xenopodis]
MHIIRDFPKPTFPELGRLLPIHGTQRWGFELGSLPPRAECRREDDQEARMTSTGWISETWEEEESSVEVLSIAAGRWKQLFWPRQVRRERQFLSLFPPTLVLLRPRARIAGRFSTNLQPSRT